MSDERIAKALEEITRHLKDLTRIFEAINTNLTQWGQLYKNETEWMPPEKYKAEWYDPAQLTFGKPEDKKEGE